jgi:hypothetical protein
MSSFQDLLSSPLISYDQLKRLTRVMLESHYLLSCDSNLSFKILGSTRNVYTVNLNAHFTCDCPDVRGRRTGVCKHIGFVLCKVAKLYDIDIFLRRRLSETQKSALRNQLSVMMTDNSVVNDSLRVRFEQICVASNTVRDPRPISPEDECPICYELLIDPNKGRTHCRTCLKSLHNTCMEHWLAMKRSTCVYCRTPWHKNYSVSDSRYVRL